MAGRRRGARSGRGWDAAPPRAGAPGAGRVRGGRGSTGRDHGFAAGEGADPEVDGFDWPEGAEAVRSGAGGDAPGRWTRRGGGRDRSDDEVSGVVRGGSAPDRDESELAREICLRQLAVRPRTRAELAGAMARRGISEKVAEEVLDRYDEVGIIDDAAFARAWVSSRHHGRGLARRALANELRQRGVDGD
ncbi:MAG TPA: regulatory protein RecX, partial [Micromonospora sp.]